MQSKSDRGFSGYRHRLRRTALPIKIKAQGKQFKMPIFFHDIVEGKVYRGQCTNDKNLFIRNTKCDISQYQSNICRVFGDILNNWIHRLNKLTSDPKNNYFV